MQERFDRNLQFRLCLNIDSRGKNYDRVDQRPKARKRQNDTENVVIEEVQDTLLLAVYSLVNDWVLDSGASFHTISHYEIMQNYVYGNFDQVYLADGRTLDVVGFEDVHITLPH